MGENEWKLESSGRADAKRIVFNGEIVALVLQLGSGWWVLCDLNGDRLPSEVPQMNAASALRAYKRRHLSTTQGEKTNG